MSRIYPVCQEMVREVGGLAKVVGRFDRDQARQLRKSAVSVVLNVAEGAGLRGGNRRLRYESAVGSARETLANLEAAEGLGYLQVPAGLRDRFDHIIGTLMKIVR